MKTIGFILILFLVFYFVWQFIKRSIFIKIFKTLNNFPQNNMYDEERKSQKEGKNKNFRKDIKWDAETIDFEEIPDYKDKPN